MNLSDISKSRMSDRRKKARMMSDSDRDDDILTLRFLMNGKVRYLYLLFEQFMISQKKL